MTTIPEASAAALCELCAGRTASTHITSLFPDGLNGESYGPLAVCSWCASRPPEQLYRLARQRCRSDG